MLKKNPSTVTATTFSINSGKAIDFTYNSVTGGTSTISSTLTDSNFGVIEEATSFSFDLTPYFTTSVTGLHSARLYYYGYSATSGISVTEKGTVLWSSPTFTTGSLSIVALDSSRNFKAVSINFKTVKKNTQAANCGFFYVKTETYTNTVINNFQNCFSTPANVVSNHDYLVVKTYGTTDIVVDSSTSVVSSVVKATINIPEIKMLPSMLYFMFKNTLDNKYVWGSAFCLRYEGIDQENYLKNTLYPVGAKFNKEFYFIPCESLKIQKNLFKKITLIFIFF